MPLQPFSIRVAPELLLKKIDREWASHKLPTDDIYIPPRQIPDQDSELNYLLEADELNWQDNKPATLRFEHRQS